MRHVREWLEVAEKEGGWLRGQGAPVASWGGPRAGLQSIWEGRREGPAGSAGWATGLGRDEVLRGQEEEASAQRGWVVEMSDELHPRPGRGDNKKKTKAKPVIPKSSPSRLHLGHMSSETGVGAALTRNTEPEEAGRCNRPGASRGHGRTFQILLSPLSPLLRHCPRNLGIFISHRL